MGNIVSQDLERIFDSLTSAERAKFYDSVILLTGAAGLLGFYFVNFFANFREKLGIKKLICLDNFRVGRPKWLKDIAPEQFCEIHDFDIVCDDISTVSGLENADYIFHMASIASPTFYRKYPIETLDANVWGLRKLLDYYSGKKIKGLEFFSSSEIYGDAAPESIPTPETYRGNVDCQGPRACYDEAKRFGETMCYLFRRRYNLPVTIVRPFNNYGPGMRLNDKRVPADFAEAVYKNRDIEILSDGTPTRTFCYISDAITGYLKGILYAEKDFQAFNIGTERPEISIKQLAEIYQEQGKKVFQYSGKIILGKKLEKKYGFCLCRKERHGNYPAVHKGACGL